MSCKWKGRQYLSNLKDVIHPKRETEGEIMGTGDEEEKKNKLKVQHSCTSLVATKEKIIES